MPPLPTFPNRSVLTPRQLEITAWLVHGLTNKETARIFTMALRTVKHHAQKFSTNSMCTRY
jgi:DNA-binding CsgD family transcriptional regulator